MIEAIPIVVPVIILGIPASLTVENTTPYIIIANDKIASKKNSKSTEKRRRCVIFYSIFQRRSQIKMLAFL